MTYKSSLNPWGFQPTTWDLISFKVLAQGSLESGSGGNASGNGEYKMFRGASGLFLSGLHSSALGHVSHLALLLETKKILHLHPFLHRPPKVWVKS